MKNFLGFVALPLVAVPPRLFDGRAQGNQRAFDFRQLQTHFVQNVRRHDADAQQFLDVVGGKIAACRVRHDADQLIRLFHQHIDVFVGQILVFVDIQSLFQFLIQRHGLQSPVGERARVFAENAQRFGMKFAAFQTVRLMPVESVLERLPDFLVRRFDFARRQNLHFHTDFVFFAFGQTGQIPTVRARLLA